MRFIHLHALRLGLVLGGWGVSYERGTPVYLEGEGGVEGDDEEEAHEAAHGTGLPGS